MTLEQLKRAREIEAEAGVLAARKKALEKSTEVVISGYSRSTIFHGTGKDGVLFATIEKLITEDTDRRIAELETEFQNL
jgi:hypothetical protein